MNKKAAFIFLLVVVIGGLVIFTAKRLKQGAKSSRQSDKLQVVTSFYPLYFFAKEISGDRAEITNITPAGAEPHDYEPTATDLARIESSRLLILNGGGLEAWGDNIKKNINPERTIVAVAGEGLATAQVEESGKTITDPHVWLSPPLAERMADKILQGFIEADPANKNYYQTNTDLLKIQLSDLDKTYRQGLADCAEKNIITSHAAFGYLAAAYGLKQVAIAGLSPDAEPSPKQLSLIAKFAKDNNIKYIFFENLLSPKLSQTIASEVGAQTLVLNPLEGLSADELNQSKNYLTEMQSNLINLQTALQCK